MERGTGWGFQTPMTLPPPPPLLFLFSTETEVRLYEARGAESGSHAEGEILLICVEFYYFKLFGS